ncbi:hypothetical protein CPB85DRAFT_1340717 [Mucidula mucida]|nr:hypothetical protein CPB85DRAFT_1340717 [Mucidula mucida]
MGLSRNGPLPVPELSRAGNSISIASHQFHIYNLTMAWGYLLSFYSASMSSLISRLTLGFGACSKSAQTAELRLPQELLDLIVDELHADGQSLRACALAGRPLLQRARAHLFRELVLTPVSAQRASPSPHLYPYVQHLRLIGLGNRGPDQWSAQSRTLGVVSQMTNVREVSLINVELTLLYNLHWASTIDTLFLNILRVESRSVFFDLMKQLPNLRHFSFYQFHTLGEEDSGDGMESEKDKIRLKTLEVCFTYSRSDVVDILIHPESERCGRSESDRGHAGSYWRNAQYVGYRAIQDA